MNEKILNAKELYEAGRFKELIENYEDSINPENIFLVLASFIAIDKINEAYKFYTKKRKHIEVRFLERSLNFLFLILSCMEDKILFNIETKRLENLPYTSQENEEIIKNLDKIYSKYDIKESKKNIDNNEDYKYLEMINSNKIEDVIYGMNYINQKYKDNISIYSYLYYSAFEKRDKFDEIKALLLAQLYGLKYDRNINFFKKDQFFMLNPSESFEEFSFFESNVINILKLVSKYEKTINLKNDISYEFMIKSYLNLPSFYNENELKSLLKKIVMKHYKKNGLNYKDDLLISKLKLTKKMWF